MAVAAMVVMVGGCSNSSAPKTPEQRQSLVAEADAALLSMIAKDPSLRDFVDRSPGYAIYPNVGKAGVGIGGAYGRGVLYEHGRPTGYTELKQGSVGLQLGAQSYAELIVFENDAAIARIKSGDFDVGGEASAVALKANASTAASFQGGAAVFQMSRGGLMAAAAINGQKLNYQPMDNSGQNQNPGADATTAGDRSSSVRTVDHNLPANSEMKLRTEHVETTTATTTPGTSTTGNAQTPTQSTEQRIEQRHESRPGDTNK
jgi:lipid-binding SYLF domain-containing protein